jgi:tRNA(Ile)-lysidine synthase
VLDLSVLAGKPRALWRRALHRWLAATPYRGDLSRQGFTTLLVAAMRGRRTRHSLGCEGFAVIRDGRLYYKKTRSPSARK